MDAVRHFFRFCHRMDAVVCHHCFSGFFRLPVDGADHCYYGRVCHYYFPDDDHYSADGMFQRGCKVRISREGEQIFEGDLASLKRFKDDVKEVKAGFECGLVFEGFGDFQELDIVEAYTMVEVPR